MRPLEIGLLVQMAVSFCGYVTLIVTILSTRKFQTTSHKLIALMGIADVLNLATSLLSAFARDLTNNVTEMYCIVIYTPAFFFALSSRNLFVLVAAEKYIRVCFPLRYEVLLSNTKIGIAIVCCFLSSLLISMLPVFGVNNIARHEAMQLPWRFKNCYGFIVFRGDFLLAYHSFMTIDTILCLILYARVLLIARKQARQIHAMAIPVSLSSTIDGSITSNIYKINTFSHNKHDTATKVTAERSEELIAGDINGQLVMDTTCEARGFHDLDKTANTNQVDTHDKTNSKGRSASRGAYKEMESNGAKRKDLEFHEQRMVHKTARGVKVLVILIIIYVITKFPMFTCYLIQYNYFRDQTILKFGITQEFYASTIILSQMNSVLFPIVYIFGNREISSRLRNTLLKIKALFN